MQPDDVVMLAQIDSTSEETSTTSSSIYSLATKEIIFIDSAVEEYQSLVLGAKPGIELILLDSELDGIRKITEVLSGRTDISSLHIVSHGMPGSLLLGSTWLSFDNLAAYTDTLQQWKSALTPNADILLYGCNVASGEMGQAFVNQLSQLTGANIAASDDLTGSTALGGDWEFEVTTGKIQTDLAFSPAVIASYSFVLAAPVIVNKTITVNEGTVVTVTSAMLGVTDADTAAVSLTYTLTSLPTTGVIKLNGTNVAVNGKFTQADINNGRVTFTHNGSETTSDSFGFSVSDVGGAGNTLTRISVATDGTQSNSNSFNPAISADGRYVTFQSAATNLVDGDTNNTYDIFLHDRTTGETTRISQGTGGIQSNGGSGSPSISADGRYVTFHSSANNLVSGGDPNVVEDIYLYDRDTEVTTRIASGTSNNYHYSINPSISADGRYITFYSTASNFVSGDTNNRGDIFLYDRTTGTTTRVSGGTGSTESNGNSFNPALSADGRYVTFHSGATNLVDGDTNRNSDVFLYDRDTGETTRLSQSTGGIQGDLNSVDAAISANGRYATFTSNASNLIAGETNFGEVYLRDRITGTTTRVVQGMGGTQSNGISGSPSISADGRYVTFQSGATNLVSGDTNIRPDIFLYDRVAGTTNRLSQSTSGTQGNSSSYNPSISTDGRYVAFESVASNLVSGDTNGRQDIFVASTNSVTSVAGTATITINPINDAPVLNNSGTPTLTAIDEDPTSNNGTLISTLLATGAGGNPITDADIGAVEGIAVTGVNNTNGTWQYSLNSGTSWLNFSVSATSATLLRDTALVRFVPKANYNGIVTNGITFRAWDATDGRANGTTRVNPGVGGGSTAFSPLSESASITVNPVDEPGFTLTPISGNTTEGGGTASFTLKLNTRPTANVTLNFSSSDTTEGQLVTNSLTFTSNNWNTAQTVTVRGVDDVLFDGNVAYKVVTAAAISADANYNNLNPVDVTVTNTENDVPLARVINGKSRSETLNGTSQAERIYGNRGNDRVIGGFGSDQIFGGDGIDTLIGDTTDVLAGSTFGMNDLILGGMGNDSIYGCGGDDLLYGEAGNDQIWGNDGNDRLWGGLGNDILTGGAGIDTFVLARGEGIDTIADFTIGEDKIGLAGGITSSQLSITQQGSLTRITDTVTGQTLANLTGINAASLIANANSFVVM